MKAPRKRTLDVPEDLNEMSPSAYFRQDDAQDPEGLETFTEEDFNYLELCVMCNKNLDRFRKHDRKSSCTDGNGKMNLLNAIRKNPPQDCEDLINLIQNAPSKFSYHRDCYKKLLKVSILFIRFLINIIILSV